MQNNIHLRQAEILQAPGILLLKHDEKLQFSTMFLYFLLPTDKTKEMCKYEQSEALHSSD